MNTALCIAIGAAPEAVHEPFRLAELIEQAFRALQIDAGATSPAVNPAMAGGRPILRERNVSHTTPKSRIP
jgi:hypothetical protein